MIGKSNIEGCLVVDGKIMCLDAAPKDKSKCVNLSGYNFCESTGKSKSFKEEFKKSWEIVFYPRLTTDGAKYMETKFIEYTLGFFIASLGFTLSFYLKDLFDMILFTIIPPMYSILTILLMVLALTGLVLLLAFIEYRLKKAAKLTTVLEKFAEKKPLDVINTMIDL